MTKIFQQHVLHCLYHSIPAICVRGKKSSQLRYLHLFIFGIILCTTPIIFAADKSDAAHQNAINLARQNDYEAALKILRTLVSEHPDETRYRNDYIVVLSWAGRDEQITSLLPTVNFDNTPLYVLEAIAKSARNTKRFDDAINVYKTVLKQHPDNKQSNIGLALTYADTGQYDKAEEELENLLNTNSNALDVLQAQAYVYEASRNYMKALKTYDRILEISPTNRDALRGRILTASRLGAPHRAIEEANANPDLLSEQEMYMLQGDQAATAIRWGRLTAIAPQYRYQDTDAAIELLEQQLGSGDKTANHTMRLYIDLLVAYRDRRYMDKAIKVYEILQTFDKALPAYGLSAAGDVYLNLRQPEKAIPLFTKSLDLNPNDIDTQISLFYAYIESNDFDTALSHIDQVVASKRLWVTTPGAVHRQWNPEKMTALITAGLARAFATDYVSGQESLSALAKQAPANVDIRNELAHIYIWRGWPRRALDEFSAILTLEPEHVSAQTGIVESLASMGDWAEADAALTSVARIYDDDPKIIRLQRRQETHQLREVWIEATGRPNSSDYEGSREFGFNAYYYDRYWSNRLRPFVHAFYQQADFSHKTIDHDRLGAGLHYLARNIEAQGEIKFGGTNALAMSINATWHHNDYLSLKAALDTDSDDTPLQARSDDIDATFASIGALYRFNERRDIGATLNYYDFNDDNRRVEVSLYGKQQLYNTAKYRLDGKLLLYRQNNRNIHDTAYFNPTKMESYEFSLINQWRTYRHYDRALLQRLVTTAGVSNQQDFNSEMTWSLTYEHHWDLDDRFSIRYGISRSQAVYDGRKEHATDFFFNLNKRF